MLVIAFGICIMSRGPQTKLCDGPETQWKSESVTYQLAGEGFRDLFRNSYAPIKGQKFRPSSPFSGNVRIF